MSDRSSVSIGADVVLHCADCLDVLPVTCDAVVADPPYNIGKAEWDRIANYGDWCRQWIAAASAGLKQQGAFWCFHSQPSAIMQLASMIEAQGRPLRNLVVWEKADRFGDLGRANKIAGTAGLRCFFPNCEWILYHADDGLWERQGYDLHRGEVDGVGFLFEPLRAYLLGELQRAGWTQAMVGEAWRKSRGNKGGMERHWFGRSQWELPTRENYEWLRELVNAGEGEHLRREYEDLRREYEDLRREYEDLRREYEDLRPTWNNPGKVTNVWRFAPAVANGHESPKPVGLLRRIVEATTNPGDLVLDPFAGRGACGVACLQTGRRYIGIERDPEHFDAAVVRLTAAAAQPALFDEEA